MGIFGNSSPFDQDVERATSENNTHEEWGLILEICDRAGASPAAAKECLRAVMRRLGHPDPHVQVHAATLLDACVANCGRAFHLEVASRDFEAEFRRVLQRAQPPVVQRLRAMLRKWAEGEFRTDPQLDLVVALHAKLRAEGGEPPPSAAHPAAAASSPAAPAAAAAAAQREQEELARAIALSLRDSAPAPAPLYPRVEAAADPPPPPPPALREVRALYDFEAAEDNELTFAAGEIVVVTDSSDPNWWKGRTARGEGLFPANFVTTDLADPPPAAPAAAAAAGRGSRSVQFASPEPDEEAEAEAEAEDEAEAEAVDEAAIDRALAALHEADPERRAADEATTERLEARALRMGGAVDAMLQRADTRHARLAQLSADLVDALNLYHDLMRDPHPHPHPHPHPQPPPFAPHHPLPPPPRC